MVLELLRVPYQPYIWGRVFDNKKQIGAITNRTGTFDIQVSNRGNDWIHTNIKNTQFAMNECLRLYLEPPSIKREITMDRLR